MPPLLQLLALCALPVIALAAPVVGSGTIKTEAREVNGFHAITLGVPASVEIRQGPSEGLRISGDDNVLPLVETKVVNGVLNIKWIDRNTDVRSRKLEIVVDAKGLDELVVGGSGSMRAASLAARSLKATIGGSGSIALDKLDADALKATIGGSGQLRAAGRADKFDAAVAGSGSLQTADLQARDVHLAMQGSPDAAVRARDTLAVTVAGSGSVTYRGTPKVTQTIMGSGSVRSAGD